MNRTAVIGIFLSGLVLSGLSFAVGGQPASVQDPQRTQSPSEVLLVKRVRASVELVWESLERGKWVERARSNLKPMESGTPLSWDENQTKHQKTGFRQERLLLSVHWDESQGARVTIVGWYALQEGVDTPVVVHVRRPLADGDAWTWGVMDSSESELRGHRVVAHVSVAAGVR